MLYEEQNLVNVIAISIDFGPLWIAVVTEIF